MQNNFAYYINNEDVSFKYAKGISDRSGKEFHLFDEIILFLGGDAELISETMHTKLKPNTLIVIPKETYHQFIIKGNQEEYCRCVFQFSQSDRDNALKNMGIRELFITDCDKNISYLFSKMMRLSSLTEAELSCSISNAVLILLLDEIRAKKSLEIDTDLNDILTKQALEYIAENLTQPIRTEDIANRLNVSPSTLMHTFKKNMKISPHQYIIKKRLLLAHTKISSGEAASLAAIESGFGDYSGFYKQYKKMFDTTPSSKKSSSV